MNESIAQYWQKTNDFWNQFNKTQKWMIIGAAAFTLLTLSLVIYHFSKTEYATAYTDLDPADAASIKEYLDNQGIPYKFSNDGTAIGVPSKHLTNVKIEVEGQNLIHNGSFGYGIFRENISSIGMTDSQFEVLSVDAKAGEIQQLINAIDGVTSSKVLLTMPESSVFLRNDLNDEASASVVVTLDPRVRIDQRKIDTMYNLVHKSVAHLPMENITISDQSGELLPTSRLNQHGEGISHAVLEQFEIKKQYETDIQKNVQSFLSAILGPDKVVVNVVALLNFDQINQEEKIFTPVNEEDQAGIERSVQEIQRTYTSEGGDAAPGGIAGTGEGDIPRYPGMEQSGATSSEEMESIVNYEINEISRSIVSSPYVVQDLTISVGIEPPDADDPSSLTAETRDAIERTLVNIVAASLSDSNHAFTAEELQGKVSVITQSFKTPQLADAGMTMNDALLFGLAGAAAAALVGGGIYYVVRRRRQSVFEEEIPGLEDAEEEIPTIDFETNQNQIRRQLETLAHRKPEEFVNLLRTWLAEE